jgi:hypothetical protein
MVYVKCNNYENICAEGIFLEMPRRVSDSGDM